MKKVLIAYFSHSGETEKMAGYIAEGVRFSGQQASVEKMSVFKSAESLAGYEGYIFGSPTFSLNIPVPVESFLALARASQMQGKLAGAFGAYRHEVSYEPGGMAVAMIFEAMQTEFHMEPFELGPLKMKEEMIGTTEGMRACQDYGRVFGERLGI
jgi:flavodoxin